MDKIAALTEILSLNPGDSFARYGLAMALAAEGRGEDALREYAATTEHDPDYVPAYQMSAQLLLKLGRSEDPRAITGRFSRLRAHRQHPCRQRNGCHA